MTHTSHHRRPARLKRRNAMSLMELVLSLAILSIILAACGSSVVIATRALNNGVSGPSAQAAAARVAADQMTSDFNVATSFSERTAAAVTFTVPDRIGGTQADTVRYAWSGAAGSTITVSGTNYTIAPYTLTRQFNTSAPFAIATDVEGFTFNYLLRTAGSVPSVPAAVESAQVQLDSHYGVVGNKAFAMKAASWPAQYFQPTLPNNTVSWKINTIQLLLLRSGTSTGTLLIQVRTVDSSQKPTATVLGSYSLDVTTVSSSTATWVNVPFTGVSGLSPSQGVAIVVSTTAASPASIYYDSSAADVNMAMGTSTNSGASWSTPVATQDLQFYIYGTFSTPGSGATTTAQPLPVYQ